MIVNCGYKKDVLNQLMIEYVCQKFIDVLKYEINSHSNPIKELDLSN
jgi:hypothetical protein